MADTDTSTSTSTPSKTDKTGGKADSFFQKHKTAVYVMAGLAVAIIIYMLVKGGSGSGTTASTSTTGASPQTTLPDYTGSTYGYENGGGALSSDLAGLTTAIQSLQTSVTQATPPVATGSNPTTINLGSWVAGEPESQQKWNADLNNIAAHYNISVSTLESANPQITNPNSIAPGTIVNIPAIPASTSSTAS